MVLYIHPWRTVYALKTSCGLTDIIYCNVKITETTYIVGQDQTYVSLQLQNQIIANETRMYLSWTKSRVIINYKSQLEENWMISMRNEEQESLEESRWQATSLQASLRRCAWIRVAWPGNLPINIFSLKK